MQDSNTVLNLNSPAWVFFVKASFAVSLIAMGVGIVFLPSGMWEKGFLAMGTLTVVTSSFMVSKTLRDDFEAKKTVNRLSEAKVEKILKEVDAA